MTVHEAIRHAAPGLSASMGDAYVQWLARELEVEGIWSPGRALAALDVIEAARSYWECEGDHCDARWRALSAALDRWDGLQ